MDKAVITNPESPTLAGTPAPTPLLRSTNDDEIVALYLGQLDSAGRARYSTRTLESYRRDIKRLRLFLGDRRLAQVTVEDTQQLIAWLVRPPPELVDAQCRRPIDHPLWRPFYRNGLSPSAVKQQLASLKAFYRWLADTGHIQGNPFALVKTAAPPARSTPKRQLHAEDLHAVARYLEDCAEQAGIEDADGKSGPPDRIARRLARQRWLWFGYLLSGLRLSELIGHTTGHLYAEHANGHKVWMIAVTGKGRHGPEPHPLPDRFIQELWRYRRSLALPPWPDEPQPLVLNLSGQRALNSRSGAFKEFKQLVNAAAASQQQRGHYDSAARLACASTHWLRHSFVTSLLDLSHDIPAVSHLARHRDIRTTMAYDHSELPALKELLDQLAVQFEPPTTQEAAAGRSHRPASTSNNSQ